MGGLGVIDLHSTFSFLANRELFLQTREPLSMNNYSKKFPNNASDNTAAGQSENSVKESRGEDWDIQAISRLLHNSISKLCLLEKVAVL